MFQDCFAVQNALEFEAPFLKLTINNSLQY